MAVSTHDPLCMPLQGEHLIEASAGTGKTFTLTTLYLRLLLGLDRPPRPSPLRVNQILVVTFTEAAAHSLRERIRSRIEAMHQLCLQGTGTDPLHALLCANGEQTKHAATHLLLAAAQQLDEAAIYTLHGFCHHILQQYAIQAGTPFTQHLQQQNNRALQQQAVNDYWRHHFYNLPPIIANVIKQHWSDPEALCTELTPYLAGDPPQLLLHDASQTIKQRHQEIIDRLERIQTLWNLHRNEVEELVANAAINKQRYPVHHRKRWIEEVDQWATRPIEEYRLPPALARWKQSELQSATLQGCSPPRHALFSHIDTLYTYPLTLYDVVISQALHFVRDRLPLLKQQQGVITFDDLLEQLDRALQSEQGEILATIIRHRYPAALVDEFQDTDPVQYRIFHTLYNNQPQTLWVLIGDPKQAIYGFRGADIFTYIRARRSIQRHYTLTTNWRSSAAMVAAVNRLFVHCHHPFVFKEEIPFIPLNTPPEAAHKQFTLHNALQAALQFHLLTTTPINLEQYRQKAASCCALAINHWLASGLQQQAFLEQGGHRKAVTADDIVVLVRTAEEAELIQQALLTHSIPSVYLSQRSSVFSTREALELLHLLRAVLNPAEGAAVRAAIATTLFAWDAAALDRLNQEDLFWDQIVTEFYDYQYQWHHQGVLALVHQLLHRRKLVGQLLNSPGGEQRLYHLRHLGELLQSAAYHLESKAALVRWLENQIACPDPEEHTQQIRLVQNKQLIKIITLHKAKGLEYPLVWLPFPCSYRKASQPFYHDADTTQPVLDLRDNAQSWQHAETERLAEDLRLLYVGLTRAIFHCSVSVAPLHCGRSTVQGVTDLHHSALGYLIQKGQAGDSQLLSQSLNALQSAEIALQPWHSEPEEIITPRTVPSPTLHARQFNRTIDTTWQVTSYSKLHLPSSDPHQVPELHWETEQLAGATDLCDINSIHHFPRGTRTGILLHTLLQRVEEWGRPLNKLWITEQLTRQGFDHAWSPLLQHWLTTILNTPLLPTNLKLSQLTVQQRQAEVQFYLPLRLPLQVDALEQLLRRYDPLSQHAPSLYFQQVYGFLQGVIDLIFSWQGHYYLLDYKSNWLGTDITAYHTEKIHKAMRFHRYDLQYQLYTVALHRYLRHRLPHYDYQTHFGGVFYLFLRGMHSDNENQGLFFCRPPWELIKTLDSYFSGVQLDDTEHFKAS